MRCGLAAGTSDNSMKFTQVNKIMEIKLTDLQAFELSDSSMAIISQLGCKIIRLITTAPETNITPEDLRSWDKIRITKAVREIIVLELGAFTNILGPKSGIRQKLTLSEAYTLAKAVKLYLI